MVAPPRLWSIPDGVLQAVCRAILNLLTGAVIMCEVNSVCGGSYVDPIFDLLADLGPAVKPSEVNRLQSVCNRLEQLHYMPSGLLWEAVSELNEGRAIGMTAAGYIVTEAYKGGRAEAKFKPDDINSTCLRRINLYRASLGYVEAEATAVSRWFWLTMFDAVELNLRLATGDELGDVYEEHRIGSCMRDKIRESGSRDIISLYTDNPETVGVAYMLQGDSGLLCSPLSFLYYMQDGEVVVETKNYSRGYLMPSALFRELRHRLIRKAFGEYLTVDEVPDNYTLRLSKPSSGVLPYIDTFYSFDVEGDSVLLSKYGRTHQAHHVEGTTLCGGVNAHCYYCGGCLDDCSTEIDGEQYCSDCYVCCPVTDEYVSTDDCSYIELHSGGRRWASVDYVLVSDYAIRYMLVETEDGPYISSDDAIESEEGLYYLPGSDLYATTDDGAVYAAEDVVETIDGENLYVGDCEEVSGWRRRQ